MGDSIFVGRITLMATKTYNHNGKQIKPANGKNIRVSTAGWEAIRRFCFDNNLVMGGFVETTALAKIAKHKPKK